MKKQTKKMDWEALAVFMLGLEANNLYHMLKLRSVPHSQKEHHIKMLRRALRQNFDGGDRDKVREQVFKWANEILEKGQTYLKSVEQGRRTMIERKE